MDELLIGMLIIMFVLTFDLVGILSIPLVINKVEEWINEERNVRVISFLTKIGFVEGE